VQAVLGSAALERAREVYDAEYVAHFGEAAAQRNIGFATNIVNQAYLQIMLCTPVAALILVKLGPHFIPKATGRARALTDPQETFFRNTPALSCTSQEPNRVASPHCGDKAVARYPAPVLPAWLGALLTYHARPITTPLFVSVSEHDISTRNTLYFHVFPRCRPRDAFQTVFVSAISISFPRVLPPSEP
jgi:hypothetical protein